ncbi:MAG: hypothetical protein HY220_01500 [Candidatus Sungbacteria bacterium]|uniref:Uncharacterized protein n=1 Tax=Candidatus Sungiibacteriota bacterium TaxID=2750080 RepID=A0A9D6QTY4_9BACT|nr:hypothetical protein [Candidatus Sungbacteria bacterium]
MRKISKEQLIELYKTLPIDIARIYEAQETSQIIMSIGKKYALPIDIVGDLSYEIGLVLVGASPAREFIDNIKSSLGVSRDKAILIAEDVNHQLFSPIRESLKTLHKVEMNSPLIPEEKPASLAELKRETQMAKETKSPGVVPIPIKTPNAPAPIAEIKTAAPQMTLETPVPRPTFTPKPIQTEPKSEAPIILKEILPEKLPDIAKPPAPPARETPEMPSLQPKPAPVPVIKTMPQESGIMHTPVPAPSPEIKKPEPVTEPQTPKIIVPPPPAPEKLPPLVKPATSPAPKTQTYEASDPYREPVG